jgi:glycosyltransferase involved in cell wall biosynthesis
LTGCLDVTAVVCSWNCVSTIGDCLNSLKKNRLAEIILVDADSNDGTRAIASGLADAILTDPRRGLATARNLGIARARSKYVVNVGADNVMPPGSIARMIDCLEKGKYAGVSATTILRNARLSYFARAMNEYKRARYFSGERSVIGTPTLFARSVLAANPYDEVMSWSDDGDLCTRLAETGARFAIADVEVFEIGSENLRSIAYRWKGYGKSDWETYSKYSPGWSFARRVKSLLYPLRNELLRPFARMGLFRGMAILPFLLLITVIRYRSWIANTIWPKSTGKST